MRVLGAHTYFGGMLIGAKNAGADVQGSVETWGPAVQWSPRLGMNVLLDGIVPRTDVLATNPPCSRFSALSYSKFSDEQRENLSTFTELQESLHAAKASDAEVVWVESGPMLFSKGLNLLTDFHTILGWDPYFLVLKVDCLYAGAHQRRPRTHVFAAKRPFPELSLDSESRDGNLSDLMQRWNAVYPFEAVSSGTGDSVGKAEFQRRTASFMSVRPEVIDEQARFAPAVVSSRKFTWRQQQRWWSVDEYAALMGYPPIFDYAEPGVANGMMLLSKSVSPIIADYLTERVLQPYFSNAARSKHSPIALDLT
jgi:hypothetical protein